MTLVLNGGDRPITIDNILLDEIETYFESSMTDMGGCSPLVASAPPNMRNPNFQPVGGGFGFLISVSNIDV